MRSTSTFHQMKFRSPFCEWRVGDSEFGPETAGALPKFGKNASEIGIKVRDPYLHLFSEFLIEFLKNPIPFLVRIPEKRWIGMPRSSDGRHINLVRVVYVPPSCLILGMPWSHSQFIKQTHWKLFQILNVTAWAEWRSRFSAGLAMLADNPDPTYTSILHVFKIIYDNPRSSSLKPKTILILGFKRGFKFHGFRVSGCWLDFG